MFEGTIEEVAAQAEKLLSRIAPSAFCVPQSWDRRVDCLLKLADGSVIGEMVSVDELTEQRICSAGERLKLRAEGVDVPLVNELQSSVRVNRR